MSPTRSLALSVAGLFALSVGHGLAQPPKPVSDSLPIPREKDAMKAKRERAHAVLDALTAGDTAALQRNAEGLLVIAEMQVFVAGYTTDEYKFQAKAFRQAAKDLTEAAKAKNLDAATLAHSDMARTCVKCHAHFRHAAKKD
jgi:hypothetical protein